MQERCNPALDATCDGDSSLSATDCTAPTWPRSAPEKPLSEGCKDSAAALFTPKGANRSPC